MSFLQKSDAVEGKSEICVDWRHLKSTQRGGW